LEDDLVSRQRLQDDVHDSVHPWLTAARWSLQSLIAQLGQGVPVTDQSLRQVESMVQRGEAELRAIARGLQPPDLQHHSLHDAIALLTRGDLRLHFEASPYPVESALPLDTRVHLYRFMLEAIHNARRHGHATAIDLSLRLDGPGRWWLTIADNGSGIGPSSIPPREINPQVINAQAINPQAINPVADESPAASSPMPRSLIRRAARMHAEIEFDRQQGTTIHLRGRCG
jgi:signal transduction histidine kinase